MILELIIAGIMAVSLSLYFYRRQEKRQGDLEEIIKEQKKILDRQNKRHDARKKFVYDEIKNQLVFIVGIIPVIDEHRINLSKTDSHDSKVMVSTNIQKFPRSISIINSTVHMNNDIINPRTYSLLENCLSNMTMYHEEKYKISIYAKPAENKNMLLDQIEKILVIMDSDVKSNG